MELLNVVLSLISVPVGQRSVLLDLATESLFHDESLVSALGREESKGEGLVENVRK